MSTRKRSTAKKWVAFSIIMIVIVGLTSAFLLQPTPSLYDSVEAKLGDITSYYSFTGNVETKNRETVLSDKVMQISKINVKEGEMVDKGDIIITSKAGDKIKAKISGEIANLDVKENAQVMAGAKLLEIVVYDNLEVNVKVDEYDIAALEKGKVTSVKIGAIDKEIKGTVSSMSKEGQVVNDVTYFIATIDLEKDSSLKIGMSAEVKLVSKKVEGVVTLPMSAMQFDDNNKPFIFKKGEKGEAIKTDITAGINDGTTVEINFGVASGETILYPKKAAASANGGFPRPNMSDGVSGGAN